MLALHPCPTCGAQHQPWQRFCHNCGHTLAGAAGSPPAPQLGAPYCPQCGVALGLGPCYCAWCGSHVSTASVYRPTYQPPYVSTYQLPASGIVGGLVPQKSLVVAFLLTFFFGPLGLLYSSILGGIIMIPVTLIMSLVTFGLGDLLLWPVCIIWGLAAAASYNDRIARGMSA